MKLLTAEQRLAEPQGATLAIFGPSGVGKTSLLRTVDPALLRDVLFVDIEGGGLAVAGLSIASVPVSAADGGLFRRPLPESDHRSAPSKRQHVPAHLHRFNHRHEPALLSLVRAAA